MTCPITADRDEWRSERRNLVSHATGGMHTGEDMSLNDVCVAISAFRNRIYADGQERGREAAEASFKAREDALRAELQRLYTAYVRLLESGHDRIIDLGGTCDPVDCMEEKDPALRSARAILARAHTATDAGGE